ncbi:MAG: hypothetical protein GVY30_09470 [Chloroflexi bacterium]|nr:hypothetical protein [Chloroflexota bacterium]
MGVAQARLRAADFNQDSGSVHSRAVIVAPVTSTAWQMPFKANILEQQSP